MSKNSSDNNVKKLCLRLLYIIIIPIVLYDMLFIIYTVSHPYETPSFFGIKTFSIVTGSMTPEINVGDLIIVKKDENNKYQLDDIISFERDGDIITHRITEMQTTGKNVSYITKGDNNEVKDTQKLEGNEIEGKVLFKIPFMGTIALFLKNKIVFGIILVILIASYIQQKNNISKKIKRKEKREKYNRKKKYIENNSEDEQNI